MAISRHASVQARVAQACIALTLPSSNMLRLSMFTLNHYLQAASSGSMSTSPGRSATLPGLPSGSYKTRARQTRGGAVTERDMIVWPACEGRGRIRAHTLPH